MKNILGKIFLLVTSLLMFAFSLVTEVNAYPQDQYQECLLAVKSNPVVIGLPESSVQSFCDCALIAIVDDGENDVYSTQKCAKETLNK